MAKKRVPVMERRRNGTLLVLAVLALLPPLAGRTVGVTPAAVGGRGDAQAPAGIVGKPLPDVTAQGYDKKPVRLTTFKGRPTLITFWATWCGPCLKEMPIFQRLVQQSGGRLQVVAIAMQDPWETAEAFTKKHPEYRFRFLHDPDWEASESRLATAFLVAALPTNLFVDAGGTVRDYWMGSKNEEELVARVTGLMK